MEYYYIRGPDQAIFDEIRPFTKFFDSWHYDELSLDSLKKKTNLALIIDDNYSNIPSETLRYAICSLTHHRNFLIILQCHHLYSKSIKGFREILLNVQVICFSYSPSNKSMLRTFASQFFPDKYKSFLEMAAHVLSGGQFQKFYVDLSAFKNDLYRISINNVPEDGDRCFFVLK